MIPSKVPLGESFNDCIIPGKRYSFKQVLHHQRVLGRKVSRTYTKYFTLNFSLFSLLFYLNFSAGVIKMKGTPDS